MRYRARQLVNLEVQLRVVLTALAVASLVLSANFFLWLASLSSVAAAQRNNPEVILALDTTRASMTRQFLICIGLAIPMASALGIFYSFKFAGPIYRFTRYFTDLASGRWDKPCHIRKGDDLQELCRRINSGLDPMRSALRESQSIFAELGALASSGSVSVAGSGRDRFDSLLGRAAAINGELANRLPAEAPAPAEVPAAPVAPAAQGERQPEIAHA